MTVEQARARLKQVGFPREDLVRVTWIDEPRYRPLTVCRTQPAPLERAGVNSEQVLFAGRDPDAEVSSLGSPANSRSPSTRSRRRRSSPRNRT
jgi:hypothetical protein